MGPLPLEDIEDRYIRARQLFLPSTPIREASRLYGRASQIERIRRELRSPGRSVFVFGERGVGKTSLAQTVAFSEDTTEKDPELVRCYEADFSQIITKIVRHFMGMPHYDRTIRKKVTELKIGGTAGHILHRVETQPNENVRIEPAYAVDVLKQIAPTDRVPVVVVDEMDLASPRLKQDLAHFVKQLGDEYCHVKFIFTGIAKDVDDLLQAHQSAARAVASVRLEPLVVGDLVSILDTGFQALDLGISDVLKRRIAAVSDGFAYFTHLLGLKLAERALDAERDYVDEALLEDAVSDAVADIEVELKRPYDLAVRKYHDRYETLLWGLADHWQRERSSKEMWKSYLAVCRKRFQHQGLAFHEPSDDPTAEMPDESDDPDPDDELSDATMEVPRDGLMVLSRPQFHAALHRLKQKAYGEILESPQRSWYGFRMSMMRGYCRLMARRQGIHIGLKYLDTHNRIVDLETPEKAG